MIYRQLHDGFIQHPCHAVKRPIIPAHVYAKIDELRNCQSLLFCFPCHKNVSRCSQFLLIPNSTVSSTRYPWLIFPVFRKKSYCQSSRVKAGTLLCHGRTKTASVLYNRNFKQLQSTEYQFIHFLGYISSVLKERKTLQNYVEKQRFSMYVILF